MVIIDVFEFLAKLDISYEKMEHRPVATSIEAKFIEEAMDGNGAKNLFLKDKNCNYYLYVLKSNKKADLKSLASFLNCSKLQFANEGELKKYLQLMPGSVSLLGIINDNKSVIVIIDKELVNDRLLLHPNINTATLAIDFVDILKIIDYCGNESIIY